MDNIAKAVGLTPDQFRELLRWSTIVSNKDQPQHTG